MSPGVLDEADRLEVLHEDQEGPDAGVRLLLAFTGAASAQIATGNVYGIARDESGAVLPGAQVKLTSQFGTRSTLSGTDGAFRLLGLERGDYAMTLSLAGFASTLRRIRVTTGENVDVVVVMKVTAVAETVEVHGGDPARGQQAPRHRDHADERGAGPGAERPRPLGVLKAVPGVAVERVNIAGNENGQQLDVSSKGQPPAENTWNLDGMVITDMAAAGGSSAYFDFGAFEEITVTTGGTDLAMATGGAGINLTTKRGTNAFHGSARYLVADERLSFGNIDDQGQAPFVPNDLATDPRLRNPDGTYRDQGDRIESLQDYGFELAGPVLKDKLWFFASYGKQDIELVRMDGTPDDTLLPAYNAKLNWQATSKTTVSAYYFLSIKQKFGRQRVGPARGRELPLGPGQRLYGRRPAGRDVEAAGRPHLLAEPVRLAEGNVLRLRLRGRSEGRRRTGGHVRLHHRQRDRHELYVRGRAPAEEPHGRRQLLLPGPGRQPRAEVRLLVPRPEGESSTSWHGNQLYGYINSGTNVVARLMRSYEVNYGGKYLNGYLGDIVTTGRFTFNVGLRFDSQSATNLESKAMANAASPICCRMRSSRATTARFRTGRRSRPAGPELRARRVAQDDGAGLLCPVLPAAFVRRSGTREPDDGRRPRYGWTDANGDHFVQPDEVNLNNLRY